MWTIAFIITQWKYICKYRIFYVKRSMETQSGIRDVRIWSCYLSYVLHLLKLLLK